MGVPNINQMAREVPPFNSSLSSSGLFILLSKVRIFFWIGSEYFASYLCESDYDQWSNLISEELFSKLVYLFNRSERSTDSEDGEREG